MSKWPTDRLPPWWQSVMSRLRDEASGFISADITDGKETPMTSRWPTDIDPHALRVALGLRSAPEIIDVSADLRGASSHYEYSMSPSRPRPVREPIEITLRIRVQNIDFEELRQIRSERSVISTDAGIARSAITGARDRARALLSESTFKPTAPPANRDPLDDDLL